MHRATRQCWWSIATVGILMPLSGQAQLTIIYDSGQTQPIAPYLEVFASTDAPLPQRPATPEPALGAADPKAWLPLRSPGLTPGPVEKQQHGRPFARPFFLIGSDPRSRQWLQAHRDRLKAIGAVGMLVQADNEDDLRAIADLADGLPVLPASAGDIAKALGISHYPVLISAHGIEQ